MSLINSKETIAMMPTEEEVFYFDLNGFIVLKGALSNKHVKDVELEHDLQISCKKKDGKCG